MKALSVSEIAEYRKAIPLFVYGTLRVGQPLHYWLAPCVLDVQTGTVNGHDLMTLDGIPFPFMVHGGGGVTGDLFWCEPGLDLTRTIQMEVGAGYRFRMVDVYTDSDVLPIPAGVFVAPRERGMRRIECGDWVIYTEEQSHA